MSLSNEAESAVDQAATRGERGVSIGRALFCLSILLRFALISDFDADPDQRARALMTVPAVCLALIASVFSVRGSRSPLRMRHLIASTLLDTLVCFFALAPNAIWPWARYRGLLFTPEPGALLVIVFGSVLRVYPRVVALSGLTNLASLLLLLFLDARFASAQLGYTTNHASLFVLFFASVSGLAFILSRRSTQLLQQVAIDSEKRVRAERNLQLLMQEQHDLRSSLSSAAINSALILKNLDEADDDVRKLARSVKEDLEQTRALVRELNDRSFVELAKLDQHEVVEVRATARSIVSAVGLRHPKVKIELQPGQQAKGVVIGGARTLQRVLFNLLDNACEGDGTRRAQNVALQIRASRAHTQIEVLDDGPGFLTQRGEPEAVSTKSTGSGLGLLLVSELIKASGGQLERRNRAEGGASVTITLKASGR